MARHILIGILMPLLVSFILLYTLYHYIYTIQASRFSSDTPWYTQTNSVCAVFLCATSLVSYAVLMLTPSKKLLTNKDSIDVATDEFVFPKYRHDIKDEISNIVSMTLSQERGEPLYCYKCKSIKPERTHHCKECHECAVKMDHHCLWINGCVDENDYKYFFLFVLYVALYSLWVEFNTVPLLLRAIVREIKSNITLAFCWRAYKVYVSSVYYLWRNIGWMLWHRQWIPWFNGVHGLGLDNISLHWYSVTMLGFLFGFTLAGFAGVHFYYIIRNKTSIESVANNPLYVRVDFDTSGRNFEVVPVLKKCNLYDLGCYRNWCSVMGSNPLTWLLPLPKPFVKNSSTHIALHPYNKQFKANILQTAQLQRQERLAKAADQ